MTDKQKAKLLYKEIKKYLRSKGIKRRFFKYANLSSFGDTDYTDSIYNIIYKSSVEFGNIHNINIDSALNILLVNIVSLDLIVGFDDEKLKIKYSNILYRDWIKHCETFKHKLYE